ncbi:hypothetical protein D4764_12G0010610 [Takifugu flavidus]|uniref:DUF7041 domain-containing protein n=1 Tax=Takifugu flavidus TaxID=433684 RepID=A0A5C6PFW1_9TELE|nr:hypothetical protein D4764_12G0010610 [Takifugu flavidus]
MFEAADDGISSSAMSPRHTQPASVFASVKLPDFWQSDRTAPWFQHAEALFHLRGVTEDDSKYYLVVAALDQQSTRRVMQLLRDPHCAESLANGSAVDLMDSMLSLLGSDQGGFLFPHLLLRQLPHPVRAALANSPSLAAADFRGLAEEADQDTAQAMVAGVSSQRRKSGLCFFHQRFGHKARRCIPPCAFEAQGNARAALSSSCGRW